MPCASFRPNNTTFTVYDTVSLSPGSGNAAGLARFPRYDPISSTIPFSPGKPVPKPGSRYVRSTPRSPAMSRLDPGSLPILLQNQPSQPSDHLFYKKNLAPLQAVKGKMK
ncbi:hypothetical protein AAW12_06075 [Sphingobacterium sp. Ag1]|uniref:hypothetical protein n=1 Tax=Sphingobacterium sp. Ag1 TaxID=1643451 RepID=UPI000627B67A|nr:hypothetical protein [Sphingobacterium sp. Ag1]KKO92148.1 hypothetical protein AAW12_06075 [Sphingobacterium sp. Ag1]